jgi:hypothetical protein
MKETGEMLKRYILGGALLVLLGVCCPAQTNQICKNAGEYCVNRETSSGVCHVQETTESPQLGTNILGPYGSRKDGVTAMCKAYDPGSTDPNKCSGAAPSGVCDNKTPGSAGKKTASLHGLSPRASALQTQACNINGIIWTNAGAKAITVTGTFEDDCHEPEDRGEVKVFNKSNVQVGSTFTFSRGYLVSVPLTVPPQGHIEYLCKSTSGEQEQQCKYKITEPASKKAEKDQ